MKKKNLFLCGFFSLMFLTGNALCISAEDPEDVKPDGLLVENYRGGNTFSRKVSTSINVYSKKDTIPNITHKSTTFNGVKVNYMEVVADGVNTIIQVDYTGGKPKNMNQFYDSGLTKDDQYYLVGGINGGFFNNNSLSKDYGAPSGAVAANYKYVDWANGWTLTPAHGNGFTTAYIESGKMLDHRYHGWNQGVWQPLEDNTVEYIENGIRYTLPAQFGLSGAYTLLVDGEVNHLGKEDSAYYNYNNGRSAVTLFGQKEDGTFLLVTTQGGIGNGDEETKLMQELGAYSAYRLDGGGSTQLMYTEGLVNWHEILVSNMDGSVSYRKAVKDGNKLTDLKDPERKNYTFEGWYSTKEGAANLDEEVKVDLKTLEFKENTKLYAGWSRNQAKVTLQIDGQIFANESFNLGDLYKPIALPSVENGWLGPKDTFVGWFTDPSCTVPYLGTEIMENVTEVTLYGKVERYVPKEYKVNIKVNEGGSVSPETLTVKEGQDAIITVLADSNHTVDYVKVNGQAQSLDEKNQLVIKNVQADTNVEVAFKKAKIDIQLVRDTGEMIYEAKVDVGFKMTVLDGNKEFVKELIFDKENTKVVLETPKREDRPFEIWVIDHVQGKVTIYPKFGETYKYDVHALAPNGGGKIDGTGMFEYGSTVTLTFTPDNLFDVDYVMVDGANVGKVNSYTFTGLNANHKVEVYFKQVAYEEGTVTVNVRDINEFNQQDLTSLSKTYKVIDDGSKTAIDVTDLLKTLEDKNYNIAENKVPLEVTYENSGDVYEITVTHKVGEETGKATEPAYRTINVKYAGIDLAPEVITQEGKKDYLGTQKTDLVTNTILNDYDIVYSFDAYTMPKKDGFTVDVTEIPAVQQAAEYTTDFTVVYTKNAIERHEFVLQFEDVNSVDKQDLSSFNQRFNVESGSTIDITAYIENLEAKGYVLSSEVDRTYTVNGNKTVKVKVAHGSEVKEENKEYNFVRTIKYEFDDNSDKNIEREQKVTLFRKVTTTKDTVTGKTTTKHEDTWSNNSSKFPAVSVEKFEKYKSNKTFIAAVELKDVDPEKDKLEYEVVVKFTRIKEPAKPQPDKPEKPSKPDKPVVNPGTKPNEGQEENKPVKPENGNKPNLGGQTGGNGNNGALSTKPDNGHGDYVYNDKGELVDKEGNIVDPDIIDPNDPELLQPLETEPTETVAPDVETDEAKETESSINWLLIGGVAIVAVIGGVIFIIMKSKKDDDDEDEKSDEEILEDTNNNNNE